MRFGRELKMQKTNRGTTFQWFTLLHVYGKAIEKILYGQYIRKQPFHGLKVFCVSISEMRKLYRTLTLEIYGLLDALDHKIIL